MGMEIWTFVGNFPITSNKVLAKAWKKEYRNRFSGVNDTTEIVSAVSMTPLKFEYNRFSRRIRSHMRNGFRV
jgi:hypothetical protein